MALAAAGVAGAAAAYWAYTWWNQEYEEMPRGEGKGVLGVEGVEGEREEEEEKEEETAGGPSRKKDGHVDTLVSKAPGEIEEEKEEETPLVFKPGYDELVQEDANAHVEQHFKSIQEIAMSTTLPSLVQPLVENVKGNDGMVENLLKLKEARAGRIDMTVEEKIELWKSVAEDSVTRVVASMWLLSLLNLQIRVQLNVLGRNLYLSSALKGISHSEQQESEMLPVLGQLSAASQEAFLSLAEYLGKGGMDAVLVEARKVSRVALRDVVLTETFDQDMCKRLLSDVLCSFSEWVKEIEWSTIGLPPPHEFRRTLQLDHPNNGAVLTKAEDLWIDADMVESMFDETKTIMDSPKFAALVSQCTAEIADLYATSVCASIPGEGIAFVKIITSMANEGNMLLEPREKYFHLLSKLPEVDIFSASIYSS